MDHTDVPLRTLRRAWLRSLVTLASIGLVVAAGVVLYRMLHDLELARIIAAVTSISWQRVALATVFVTGSYATLTLYDFTALSTLGFNGIRYRTAALAGFMGYAIGHNVGATTIAAGMVRYRVYAPYGLDALAVTRISVLAGLTFWLGNAALLGLSVAWHPLAASAIDQLSEGANRAAAFALLGALAVYITWAWRGGRRVGNRGISIVLPDGPMTLLQIGIGVVDLACAAMTLYMLAPVGYDVGLARFMVVFVCATLLGFASHAPAGIGVFDAAMLLGIPELDRTEFVASLIVFRVLYYLLPLVVALVLLAWHEFVLIWRANSRRGKRQFGSGTIGFDGTVVTLRLRRAKRDRAASGRRANSLYGLVAGAGGTRNVDAALTGWWTKWLKEKATGR